MLVRPFLRLMQYPQRIVSFGLIAGSLLLGSSYGQTSRLKKTPDPAASTAKPNAIASNPAPSAPQLHQVAPNPELPAPVLEETLPEPPVISWDGKDLTIDAENATLSSILLGIRSRTGASIEMPPSTASERVAVHLGPAPIREVLSSLLYGTDFNYVIQSSDEDANGLETVILTAKDGDTSEDSSSSMTRTADSDRRVRLMPGYAAPGKRDFEVAHQKLVEDGQQDDSPTAGLTITQDPPPTPDPPADNARASAAADSSNATQASTDSANASTPTPDLGIQVAEQTQMVTSSATTSSQVGAGSSLSNMEQNLQRMYQQRQQIQAQQNRPQAPGATN
jgi:hypothetical protein